MLKTFPTVGIVIIKNGQVLLIVKDNHPRRAYQLPGGQIEPGETPVEAARRELEETTGLASKVEHFTKLPTEWEATIEKDYGKAVFPFACFMPSDYTGHIRKTDVAAPEWVALERLDGMLLNPNTQNAINCAIELLAVG